MTRPRPRKRSTPLDLLPLEPRLVLDGTPSGVWIGQDAHDLVGPSSIVAPSRVQDIRITVSGLPAERTIQSARVEGLGGGQWLYRGSNGPWAAELVRAPGAATGDLYLEPYQVESGRPFNVRLTYDDATTADFWLSGGAADPNLRMPEAVVQVRWLGQDGPDRVGRGASVGPDGLLDAHLVLSNLSPDVPIASARVTGPSGLAWGAGLNPEGLNNAELLRRGDDPTRADLFLQADRDLSGVPLTLELVYANGQLDETTFIAGRVDPTLRVDAPPAFPTVTAGVTARWIGQDGTDLTGRGDVHVGLEGLPAGRSVLAAALSDQANALWVYRQDGVSFHADEFASPLGFRRSIDPTRADIAFPPHRDETGATLTLRLLLDDGSIAVTRFTGGASDPTRRAEGPAATSVVARPGDDLNDLANRFGTVRLSAGTYPLTRPLVLNRPVTITADPGATLLFSQGSGDPAWTAAIKIHAAHTTLDNFAVRFSGPIRWREGIDYGPAVIGSTDNLDGIADPLKVGINLTRLDLQSPPASGTALEEAVRLVRLATAQNGRIEGNTLRGGMIEFFNGPWRIAGNDYRGTPRNTFSNAVFAGHRTHDVTIENNTARPEVGSGKTWRFLVLTNGGFNDVVRGNTVERIGPRDDDTIPSANAPEIILTESYSLRFEGRPLSISSDGRLLRIPTPQGEPARTGDAVAILAGPSAGQFRRIAQALGPTLYLLDEPLPSGDYPISIAGGFVNETFQDNRIDARGGSVAVDLVLAGNHFGTRVVGNHFLGGGGAFRILASSAERPVHWGWSHAPVLGLVVDGNIVEDVLLGASIEVEHGPQVKTNRDRVYLSGSVTNTTVRWSESFLSGRGPTPGLSIGSIGSLDPGELVLSMANNRIEVPTGRAPGEPLWVHSGTINGQAFVDRRLPLESGPVLTAPGGLRLASDTGSDSTDRITRDPRLRFDAVAGASGYEFRVGSAAFQAVTSPGRFQPIGVAQGPNIVVVRAFDANGRRGPEASSTIVLDTIAPSTAAPVLRPSSDSGRSDTDRVTRITTPEFDVAGEATDAIELLRNGAVVGRRVGPGLVTSTPAPNDGTWIYYLRRTDLAGNISFSQISPLAIDTTPPPAVGGLGVGANGQVQFQVTSSSDRFEYRVGDSPTFNTLGTSTSFTPAGLAPGSNAIRVRAVDAAGNIGPEATTIVTVAEPQVVGAWIGQDGHDLVGPSSRVGADGVQDIRIALANLPAGRTVVFADVQGLGGGRWQFQGTSGHWAAALVRLPGSTTADLYIQPYQRETGRPFNVRLTFDDGSTTEFWMAGGVADPGLRTAGGQGFRALAASSRPASGQAVRRARRAIIKPIVGPSFNRPLRAARGRRGRA